MEKYSVVIPVYKSSKSLYSICEQIDQLKHHLKIQFDLIFVNDSPYNTETRETLKEIALKYSNVKVVTLRKNAGQHMAILVGLSIATGKYVITMDDDLQHPVSELPKLIETMDKNEHIEAVFALPNYREKKHSAWRNISSYLLNRVDTFFLNKPKGLMKSAFRIMTLDLAQTITTNYNAMPSISSLMLNTTHNIMNVEVKHNHREYGKSNYSFPKMASLALNNLIHYSSLPLKGVGLIGIIGFILSVGFIIYIFIRKLFWGIDFPGYATTITLISFFGGLNLFAVGLIGEYLIRIIKEQQKPKLNELIKYKTSC